MTMRLEAILKCTTTVGGCKNSTSDISNDLTQLKSFLTIICVENRKSLIFIVN